MPTKKTGLIYELNLGDTSKGLADVELKLAAVTEELKKAKKAADGQTYAKLREEQIKLQTEGARLRKEIRQQQKDFRATKFPEDSILGLRKRYGELIREIQTLSSTDPNFDKQAAEAKRLSDQLKTLEKRYGDTRRNVGNYQEDVEKALQASQDLFGGNFSSLFAAAGAGGAAIAGLELIQGGAEEVARLTQEFLLLQNQIRLTNRVSGAELQQLTETALALSNTFQVESSEISRAIGQIQDQLGESSGRAAELLQRSLLGSANATETIDRINTELRQLADLDLPSDSILAILTDAANRGINVDVLAEPIIRLREATPATVKALEDAFGSEATKELFSEFETAPLSALKRISDRLQELPPRSVEAGQILADVFAGAGEDAVETARNIGDIADSLDDLIDETDSYTQAQLNLLQANEALAQAQGALALQTKGINEDFNALGVRIKAGLLTVLSAVLLRFRAIGRTIQNFLSGKLETVSVFEIIQEDAANAVKESENVTETVDGTEKSFQRLQSRIERVKATGEAFAKTSLAAMSAEVSKLRKELEKAGDPETYVRLERQISEAENRLEEQRARFQRAADADRGITATLTVLPTLQQDPEAGIQQISDLLDLEGQARLEKEQDIQEKLNEIKAAANEQAIAQRKEQFDRELALEQRFSAERSQLIESATESLGSVIGEFFTSQELTFREFSKKIVLVALDAVEKEILLQVAAASARSLASAESVASFGVAGIAKAALITGLIKAAFAGIKAQVQNFAEGGQVLPVYQGGGRVIGRPNIPIQPNRDNVLATVRVGELFLNENQQARARLLYGKDVFARLGIPGFADGGLVGSTPQLVNPNSFSSNISLEDGDINRQAQIIAREVATATAREVATATGEAVRRAIEQANERNIRVNNLRENQIQE